MDTDLFGGHPGCNLEEKRNILDVRVCTLEDGADYPGNDITSYSDKTQEECCDLCIGNPSCQLFAWGKASDPNPTNRNRCWLKDEQGSRESQTHRVTGICI